MKKGINKALISVLILAGITELLSQAIMVSNAPESNVLDKYDFVTTGYKNPSDTIINWKDSFDTTYIDETTGCKIYTNK